MRKHISISVLLVVLLLTGCSSTPPKKTSIFSEEQQAELKAIIDRNITDDDWDRYQHEWERVGKLANYDSDIDIRKDYDKDPMILVSIMGMSEDKPELQKELRDFLYRSLSDCQEQQNIFK